MMLRRITLGIAVAACAMLTMACSHSEESVVNHDKPHASRLPPPKVPPVTINGIRYQQQIGMESDDGQVGGLLAAFNAKGERLWTLKVYDNHRRPELEGDVQDVFFRSMSLDPDGRLHIVNERGNSFLVDVMTRVVTAQPKAESTDDDDVLVPPP